MAKFSLPAFLRSQFCPLPAVHTVDLSGQTVMVTGSNGGLGLAAAKHLARMSPAKLILAVRTKSKGEVALAEIREETGFTGVGQVMILDHGDFASVSALVTQFEKEHDRLDVLIANAGIFGSSRTETKNGWESMIQVNHLSTCLLILLLLPTLERTAETHNSDPHVTVVSSDLHLMVKRLPRKITEQPAILEALSKLSTSSAMQDRYNESKLLNVFFARSLASHLPQASTVVVDSVNPGFCHSGLRGDGPALAKPFVWTTKQIICRETTEGAKTLVWAALAGKNNTSVRDTLRGAYTTDCKIGEPSDFVISQEGKDTEKRIWDETLQILGKADLRVPAIVGQYLTV